MRRGFVIASCSTAAMVALYSCSMHAAITTDDDGRVVEVSAVRFESSLQRIAMAMLVAGGNVGLELRLPQAWTSRLGDWVGASSADYAGARVKAPATAARCVTPPASGSAFHVSLTRFS